MVLRNSVVRFLAVWVSIYNLNVNYTSCRDDINKRRPFHLFLYLKSGTLEFDQFYRLCILNTRNRAFIILMITFLITEFARAYLFYYTL